MQDWEKQLKDCWNINFEGLGIQIKIAADKPIKVVIAETKAKNTYMVYSAKRAIS